MKNPVNIILVLVVIGLLGWMIYQGMDSSGSGSKSVAAESFDASGSTIIDVAGSPVKIVETKDANGVLKERGEMLDDKKTGTWTTYHSDQRAKSITSYVAGKRNGLHLEMNERGQVELQASYKDGMLNGQYTKYKSGSRKIEERAYKMDKLHGVFRKYDDRKNKLQQEIHYKDGVQDGPYRFYDEEGNITMEYVYKNGEKVSGGIVEKKPTAATE